MSGDPYWGKVSLLLSMNGSDGSTSFVDSSSLAFSVTANGNAQIKTDQSKFGGASGYFDGSGDYLSIASNAAFGFGTDAFTVEFWLYPTRNSGDEDVVDSRTSDTGMALLIGKSGAGAVRCYDGTTVRTGGTLTLNTWQHVAWSRSGSSNIVFLGGTSVISFSNAFDAGTARPLTIGANVSTGFENYQGYVDDLRITKGAARYTTNFTPPAAAFDTFGAPLLSTAIQRPIVQAFNPLIFHY